MRNITIIDAFRPQQKQDALIFDIILIMSASVFIALFAQIAIRIPFSPVPITGQTFAIMLAGLVLGMKRGVLAVLAYLGEGISGLPVFANAGYGLVHIIGPTGGYLIGFIPAVLLTGYFAEQRSSKNILLITFVLIIATAAIFFSGIMWLKHYVGLNNVMQMGFYPFIPGAVIKIALLVAIFPGIKRWFSKHNHIS